MARSKGLRWIGGGLLAVAILMLIAGEVWLKNRLSGIQLLGFWALCLLLTGGAMVAALLEVQRVRRRSSAQHKQVLEETLGKIERDVQERIRRN